MPPSKPTITSAKWQTIKAEMRDILITIARTGQAPITYSELCALLHSARVHYHSPLLVRLLDDIGSEEAAAGRPALPALVVQKQTGIPGAGYFRLEADRHAAPLNPRELWQADLAAVYAYWSEQP